jgi:hypothetical protein
MNNERYPLNAAVVIVHIKKAPVETGAMVDYISGNKIGLTNLKCQ